MSTLVKTNDPWCLITEQAMKDICDSIPKKPTWNPIPDNEADTDIRTAQIGTTWEYADAWHNHAIVRQSNPWDPVLTYVWDTWWALVWTPVILDRWSDEESYSYRIRVLWDYGEWVWWNYIRVPTKAWFQQPKILDIGTYRTTSNAPQEDWPQWNWWDWATPRWPYMWKEAHHWSSTNIIYHWIYRRDNAYRMYTEFTIKYIRS